MPGSSISEQIGKLVRSVIKPQPGECALVLGTTQARRTHELFSLHLAEHAVQAFIYSVREGFHSEWLMHVQERELSKIPENVTRLFESSDIVIDTGPLFPANASNHSIPDTKHRIRREAFLNMLQSGGMQKNRWFLIPLPAIADAKRFDWNHELLLSHFWELMDMDMEAYTLKSSQLCQKLESGSHLTVMKDGATLLEIRIDENTAIILDGFGRKKFQSPVPETHILPKGELKLQNVKPVFVAESVMFVDGNGCSIPSKYLHPRGGAVTHGIIHVKQYEEITRNPEYSLRLGLNGVVNKSTGFPGIDTKKIGNVLFSVSKKKDHEQVCSETHGSFMATMQTIDLFLDGQPLIEHGKIVF
jgi:hypothetical protein